MAPALDYLLVGGGLQSALIALALRAQRPEARVGILEREEHLGGNHTWSFHEGDVAAALREVIAPLVVHRWPGYEVAFPDARRDVELAYASITSERLHEVVSRQLAGAVHLGVEAQRVTARSVETSDGRRWEARVVIDSRGPEARPREPQSEGYQKFLGLEVVLREPVAPARPIVIDATVAQRDGLRFFYTLPFAPDRVLIEDTFYSDGPELDRPRLREEIFDYARARQWPIREVVREEAGVLPLPWRRQMPRATKGEDKPIRGGLAGGFFHPVTGYSLPVALRLAGLIAGVPPEEARAALRSFVREHQRQLRFAHLLNWLLFRGSIPAERWGVMSHLYKLPPGLIARFYALALTRADRMKILTPPVPRGFSVRRLLFGARREPPPES